MLKTGVRKGRSRLADRDLDPDRRRRDRRRRVRRLPDPRDAAAASRSPRRATAPSTSRRPIPGRAGSARATASPASRRRRAPSTTSAALARARARARVRVRRRPGRRQAAVDAARRRRPASTLDRRDARTSRSRRPTPPARKTPPTARPKLAPNDAAALYVAGQAALLAGDLKARDRERSRPRTSKEPRPLYAVGLAHALAATPRRGTTRSRRSIARSARCRIIRGALIERGFLSPARGRIVAEQRDDHGDPRAARSSSSPRARKPLAEQTRGVSPLQVALANLALAQIDFARGDCRPRPRRLSRAASRSRVDEQRFGEEADRHAARDRRARARARRAPRSRSRTGRPAGARGSRRPQISLALGKPAEALEHPRPQPRRAAPPARPGRARPGQARPRRRRRRARRLRFALKKLPELELAVVGARLARPRRPATSTRRASAIEPHVQPEHGERRARPRSTRRSCARSGEPAAARQGQGAAREARRRTRSAPDARARPARARAALPRHRRPARRRAPPTPRPSAAGNFDARLEIGAAPDRGSAIPHGGRDTLERCSRTPAITPPPRAAARGRARAHARRRPRGRGRRCSTAPTRRPACVRWQFDRERGRLALRKGDFAGAAPVAGPRARRLRRRPRDVPARRRRGRRRRQAGRARPASSRRSRRRGSRACPSVDIIAGKLALAADNNADAEKALHRRREALENDNAPRRAVAQAHFGLGATRVLPKHDDADAPDRSSSWC